MDTKIKLPFWLEGPETLKLKAAAEKYFDQLAKWAHWPASQQDPLTCEESFLNLLAYQRDIKRFEGEPLSLYRLRVHYAYINARESGSVAGFKRIFQRLEIGYVEIEERLPGEDWDVVAIRLSDSQLASNQRLIEVLIQHYGRTCRRYRLTVLTPQGVWAGACEFGMEYGYCRARLDPPTVHIQGHEFNLDTEFFHAKL
ncbi:MAG: phage tail protein [Desulfovibrio sp.]